MALFFHSDEVDQQIPFKEAVQITENALRDTVSPKGVNAPRKRLNLHREIGEGKFDTVLNIYAGGSASYGAIGAQVALHRKAIAGNQQQRPPFNPDQTELALIYDADNGSLLGVMAHRPRDFTGVADLRTPASSLAGLDLFARRDARRVGIYGAGQQAWATFAGLCELRKIESAKVYSPTPAHREGFAKKIGAKTGVPVKAPGPAWHRPGDWRRNRLGRQGRGGTPAPLGLHALGPGGPTPPVGKNLLGDRLQRKLRGAGQFRHRLVTKRRRACDGARAPARCADAHRRFG
jgi:ornithine cyclodeaminase/alanine dehydrogenase-like protein (mu-crystallin family)